MREFESLQERNERILSRFSVFDLQEQSIEDFAAGERKLARSSTACFVQKKGISDNCIRWFLVSSGASVYEVRRFENFCFCPCEDFFFNKQACKHIAITTPCFCSSCGEREAVTRGGKCASCEITEAPYLKLNSNKKPEKLGNIRI